MCSDDQTMVTSCGVHFTGVKCPSHQIMERGYLVASRPTTGDTTLITCLRPSPLWSCSFSLFLLVRSKFPKHTFKRGELSSTSWWRKYLRLYFEILMSRFVLSLLLICVIFMFKYQYGLIVSYFGYNAKLSILFLTLFQVCL